MMLRIPAHCWSSGACRRPGIDEHVGVDHRVLTPRRHHARCRTGENAACPAQSGDGRPARSRSVAGDSLPLDVPEMIRPPALLTAAGDRLRAAIGRVPGVSEHVAVDDSHLTGAQAPRVGGRDAVSRAGESEAALSRRRRMRLAAAISALAGLESGVAGRRPPAPATKIRATAAL